MKKSIIIPLVIILCLSFVYAPFSVCAEGNCSLTLTYAEENIIFSDLEINIYRIADTDLVKLSPYDGYPVNIIGITSQTEWSETASTLGGYIAADRIPPYMTAETDEDGTVNFEYIDAGLYLVTGVFSEMEGKSFTFYDFMIMVSSDDPDVTVRPKVSIDIPSDEEKTYTVTKLWKDGGSTDRPVSVTVDLIIDGSVGEKVVLDDSNNWTYSFTVDSDMDLEVAERNVSGDYNVLLTENETSIIIINTLTDDDGGNPNDGDIGDPEDESTEIPDNSYDGPGFDTIDGSVSESDEDRGTDNSGNRDTDNRTDKDTTAKPTNKPTDNSGAPQTADTFPMKLYIVICCVSGLLLVVLGLGMRRREDA